MGNLRWVIWLVLAGCQCTGPMDRLSAASTDPVSLVRDGRGGVALRGRVPVAGATVEARAMKFLGTYGAELGVDVQRLSLLGVISSGGTEGTAVFEVHAGAWPVFGARVKVYVSPAGEVAFVSATTPPTPLPATTRPEIDESAAAAALSAFLGGDPLAVKATQLGIFQRAVFFDEAPGPNVLAWQVRGTRATDGVTGYVDAISGAVLAAQPRARSARNRLIATLDGGTDVVAATLRPLALLANEDGGTSTPPEDAGMRLWSLLGDVHQYFDRTFGWDGYDGSGAPLLGFVHYGAPDTNAFWDPTAQAVAFSDDFLTPSVTAHEYGHAISRGFIDDGDADEAGALGEAFADAWAAFVTGTWVVEMADGTPLRTVWDPQGDQPPRPDHESKRLKLDAGEARTTANDYGHTHHNSAIVSYALVLWTDGGEHPLSKIRVGAVRKQRAEQVLFHAIRWRLAAPASSFAASREGLITSCLQFVTGQAVSPVPITLEHCGHLVNAFAAVGVGEPDRDLDTVVDSKDNCPDLSNFDQRTRPCEVAGSPDAAVDAGPPYAFAPCPPSFESDGYGRWPLLRGDLGSIWNQPRLKQLYCEYRAPAGTPVDLAIAQATYAEPSAAPEAHFGCWASTRPTPQLCSAGRQASAWASVPSPSPANFERAALARHAASLLTAVEPTAAACPTASPLACATSRVACPASLTLPSVTMKAHPGAASCPTVDDGGVYRAQCTYVGPGCAAVQVNAATLSSAPFKPSAPRFNLIWAETPNASLSAPGALSPCGAIARSSDDAGTVVLLSQTKKAWVSVVPGDEPSSDRAASEAAGMSLLQLLELRATPCP